MQREKKIVKTSVWGICVNIVLASFKIVIGLLASSTAVILDAVNNFSDALSSVITIVGTKLAGKKPNKKHPFGYGRIEYITSAIIAVLMLAAGVTALRESIARILVPTATDYTLLSLVVIAVAVVVKFIFGIYVKKVGKSVNSQALVASGSEAFMDGVLSASTLFSAICAITLHWNFEGWLGAVIALFIVRAGFSTLLETVNSIIGTRPEQALAEKIKVKVNTYPQVKGAYDLTLNSYGPYHTNGSIHIEVPENTTARELHGLSRQIAADIYQEFGVVLTVGVYAAQENKFALAMKQTLQKIVSEFPSVLDLHGFYVNANTHSVIFDIVVDFKNNAQEIKENIVQRMKAVYPNYSFSVVLDFDLSD